MTTGSFTDVATITTPSLLKISVLNGGALPPGVTVTSSAVTTTATAMSSSCFGASFSFTRKNHDKLFFSSSVALPDTFNPANQPVSFSLAGYNYSCVLDARGQSRSGAKLVQLRRDRIKGWIVVLRVNNDNLQQMQGVVNDNVTRRTLSNVMLRVSVGGTTFVSRATTVYSARRNLKAALSK
jgi:hypothetical protein